MEDADGNFKFTIKNCLAAYKNDWFDTPQRNDN